MLLRFIFIATVHCCYFFSFLKDRNFALTVTPNSQSISALPANISPERTTNHITVQSVAFAGEKHSNILLTVFGVVVIISVSIRRRRLARSCLVFIKLEKASLSRLFNLDAIYVFRLTLYFKFSLVRIHKHRSFHCDVCGVCLDVQLQDNHRCRAGSAHDECCICLEVSWETVNLYIIVVMYSYF